MKTTITNDHIIIWLSASDTYEWAHRPSSSWPCSHLSGNRFCAEFDSNGLLDLTINGKYQLDDQDVPADEFNAITSDFLKTKLKTDHPLYFITVGQFQS